MKFTLKLKTTIYLLLAILFIPMQATPLLAVHTKPKTENVAKTKLEKKIAKWKKKIEKWSASKNSLDEKPKPFLALGLALTGFIALAIGVYASFGLNTVVASISFVGALILSFLAFHLALKAIKRKDETKQPMLTTIISILALIISGAMMALILIGIITAFTNP